MNYTKKLGKNVLTLRRSSTSALIAPLEKLISTALNQGGQHEKISSVFSNCARPWGDDPRASGGAQAQTRGEEGPIEIEKCRTIDKPGSYKLVNNLTFTLGPTGFGTCLPITADFVTIDLAGFTISRAGAPSGNAAAAITAGNDTTGIAVRNGSISGFGTGVALQGNESIVEGLRVDGPCPCGVGIVATGIVRG